MSGQQASSYVYAELGADCVSPNALPCADGTEMSHYRTVIVRFENQAAFDIADGCMFDMVYEAFNSGLPDSWTADDALELIDMKETAEHFVIYPLVKKDSKKNKAK